MFKQSAKKLTNTRSLALAGMLLALYAVLGIFKIPIPPSGLNNRISFVFIPLAVSGMVLGPVPAAVIGVLGDFLGYLVNAGGGAYFPGYALSAALKGIVYGIFLCGAAESGEKSGKIMAKILICEFINIFFVNIILNTVWVAMTNGSGFAQIDVISRIIKNIILYPINAVIIFALYKTVSRLNILKNV